MIDKLSPDVDLVIASQQGEEEAWRLLYERHDPTVNRRIKTLLWNKNCFAPTDHAEEVKSDTWKKGFENIKEVREPAKFSSWILIIALNTVIEHLRAYCIKHQNESVSIDDAPSVTADVIPLPILIEGALMGRARLKLADELSPRFGKILRMRLLGYSFQEIASRMGESFANVRNIYYRYLQRFNEEFEKRGF
jgi:RNA polymerase sigma factor (sigma-70 family)